MKITKNFIQRHTISVTAMTLVILSLLAVFFVWFGWLNVFAGGDEKVIYIFPTEVTSVGWENPNAALEQTVSRTAEFNDFSSDNSAYAVFGSTTESESQNISSSSTTSEILSTIDEEDTLPADGLDSDDTTSSEIEVFATTTMDTDEVDAMATTSAGEKSEIASTTEDILEEVFESTVDTSASTTSSEEKEPLTFWDQTKNILISFAVTPAFAQEPGEVMSSTTAVADDILDDGFDVEGEIATGTSFDIGEEDIVASTTDAESETSTSTDEPLDNSEPLQESSTDESVEDDIASTIFATTSLDSVESEVSTSTDTIFPGADNSDDVSLCHIRGTDCYTMEFDGFDIGGSFIDTDISNMQLRFSFASKSDIDFSQDTLLIRYFHGGRWHVAGEFSLGGEFSNAMNGGYFLYALPEFASWDELADFKVVFEYNKVGDEPVSLFLDSIWLEAQYTDTSLGLFDDEADSTVTFDGENVTNNLQSDDVRINTPDLLYISDSESITFDYTDDTSDENLIIKSNHRLYAGLKNDDVYISVTNTGEKTQDMWLQMYFPEYRGNVRELSQWMRNIPFEITKPMYDSGAFLCDGGWMAADGGYQCADTGEILMCDSLNAEGTNCIVGGIYVGTEKSVEYRDGWIEANLTEGPIAQVAGFFQTITNLFGADVVKEKPDYLNIKKSSSNAFPVAPGQTIYFKIGIDFPIGSNSAFLIEAIGENGGYGLLDSWWNAQWEQRVSFVFSNPEDQDIAEYHAYISLDETSEIWAHVKPDGSDIRFADSFGIEHDYWIENWDYENQIAGIWVRIPQLYAQAPTSLNLYYGNADASPKSNPFNLFTYSELREIYYIHNSFATEATLDVLSLIPNNSITLADGAEQTLDLFESASLALPLSTSTLRVRGPVRISSQSSGVTFPTPYSFASQHSFDTLFSTYTSYLEKEGIDTRGQYVWGAPTARITEIPELEFEQGDKEEFVYPRFSQTQYRWYVNENVLSVADIWPVGEGALGQNVAIDSLDPVGIGEVVRLHTSIQVTEADAKAHTSDFRLQYAEGSNCQSNFTWEDFGSENDASAEWRGFINVSVPNQTLVNNMTLVGSDISGRYVDNGYALPLYVDIAQDSFVEYDWVIKNNNASSDTNYCFRMIHANGKALSQYINYPQLTTGYVEEEEQIIVQEEKEFEVDLLSKQKDFDIDEKPSFRFRYVKNKNILQSIGGGLQNIFGDEYSDVEFIVKVSGIVDDSAHVSYIGDGEFEVDIDTLRTFKPGRNILRIEIHDGNKVFVEDFEFNRGVLALNINKSIYSPGEQVYAQAGVVDIDGHTICDADLDLTVIGPSGRSDQYSTDAGTIFYSDECAGDTYTETPDYFTFFNTSQEIGQYSIRLTSRTKDGIHATEDIFEVRESIPFDIERVGPTRIFPPEPYTVTLRVTATDDFLGDIEEIVPEYFEVFPPKTGQGFDVIRDVSDMRIIRWKDVYMSAGETREFTYRFDAVDISPYFYVLGPLRVGDFREIRQWQIAADAVAGDMAIYRTAVAGETLTTADFIHDWDTTVREDTSSISLQTGSTSIALDAGHYAVMYGTRFDSTSGSNRSEVQTHFLLNNATTSIGWAQGYTRRSNGDNEVLISGGGIIDVATDNDLFELHSYRTDVNGAGLQRVNDVSSLSFLKLDDTWNFARLSMTATQTGPTSATWVDVGYTQQDELDTGSFSHSTTTNPEDITLVEAGHYLIFANTYGSLPSGTGDDRTLLRHKLTLDGSDIDGSYSTVYSRGDVNSEEIWEGAASIGMIIETTVENQVLNVSLNRGDGITAWTIDQDPYGTEVDRTAITIVKLPDYADYIRLDDSGTDDVNPSTLTVLGWDTEDEVDIDSFTHSATSSDSRITVAKNGDYLFFTQHYQENVSVQRTKWNQGWTKNAGTLLQYGQTGQYNRGTQSVDSGNWSGILFDTLVDTDYIEVVSQQLGATGVVNDDIKGIQGVNLDTLFISPTKPLYTQNSFRWYANENSITPTDPWPFGGEDVTEDNPITESNAVGGSDVLRLRMSLQVGNATSTMDADDFKLQYASGETCSLSLSWNDVAPIGSTTAIWRGYDNAAVADDSILATTTLAVSDELGSYEEENNSTSTLSETIVGDDIEYDWVVQNNAATTNTYYCFRMVKSNGDTLFNYTNYAQLVTDAAPNPPTLTVPFDNEKTPSLLPTFNFSATDAAGADIDYQIQVSSDYTFASTDIDDSTLSNPTRFSNLTLSSDKAPFTSGHNIEYVAQSILASSTTFYWRTRGQDTSGSGQWGEWSNVRSFSTDQNVIVSTWFQTTQEQFQSNVLLGSTASTSDSVYDGGPISEYGSVDVEGVNWSTVTLTNSYTNPVVVASPRYAGGDVDQRTVRIQNKLEDSFQIRANNHASTTDPSGITTMDYIVMEAGTWTMDDESGGRQVVAGSEEVSGMYCRADGLVGAANTVAFIPNFASAPAVLHTITTMNDSTWVTTSVDDGAAIANSPTISTARFMMQRAYADCVHDAEDIDYMAFETGHSTTTEGIEFDVAKGIDTLDGAVDASTGWATPFNGTYTTAPDVYVAGQMAINGGDGGFAITDTRTAVTTTNWYGGIDEDGPNVARTHTTEDVGLVSFGALSGTIESALNGKMTSSEIDFDWGTIGNTWGEISWNDTEPPGDILYQVEYDNNGVWELVPDSLIANNATGTDASPISIKDLDTQTYNKIRLVANFTSTPASPVFHDWTVTWKENVAKPTLLTLFDNEKTPTVTPSFTFYSTDPESQGIEYEITISTSTSFTASTTRLSDSHFGFTNLDTGIDSSPFISGETIQFTLQPGDALTNGETYWWKVRARDPAGDNAWSFWSDLRSLTVDTSVVVSTWFQTTDDQFDTDTLVGVEKSGSDEVAIRNILGEFGTSTLSAGTWVTVNLDNTYNNLVVVASPRYANTDTQRAPRIRNKTATSFQIKVDNFDSSATGTTTADWFAMEAGSWTIEDGGSGTKLIAGTKEDVTTCYSNNYSDTGGELVTFSPSFDAAPSVIGTISSENNSDWMVVAMNGGAATRQDEPSATQMGVGLGRSFESCLAYSEDIDYIAMDTGHGTNDGFDFDGVVSTDSIQGVTNSAVGYDVTFSSAFSVTPAVRLVQLLGEDGGNGGYGVQHTGGTTNTTKTTAGVDEDGTAADRSHTAEVVGVIAFETATGTIKRTGGSLEGSITGTNVDFYDGFGPKWESLTWTDSEPGTSTILYQVEYYTASGTWDLIPDVQIPYNSIGTSTGPIDLSNLNFQIYNILRPVGNFTCDSLGNCPTLSDWTVRWAEGIEVSGIAKGYDQTTDVLGGTVAVGVNGVLQVGKTATISSGTWTINNVTVFPDDIVTVFIDGVANANEAVGVTKYDGIGDITGMILYERHLSLGSDDAPELTNTDLDNFDFGAASDEDVFFDVDTNDLVVCAIPGCTDAELYIATTTIYRPDSTDSGDVDTHDIEINGQFILDSNTLTLNGSWDNNGGFSSDTSTVLFTATAGNEYIDSTSAATSSFYVVTLGQNFGTATWGASSTLDIDGNLVISYGTLNTAASIVSLAQNLTINASGGFLPGTATTTFDGNGSHTITDSTGTGQNFGNVAIDGSSKTIDLGSAIKVNDLYIGANDTFDVTSNNRAVTVYGDWDNDNIFVPRLGTVTFASTASGQTIDSGDSAFFNVIFNGVGGGWTYVSPATTTNDMTITNGAVALPTTSLAVAGSFDNAGGSFNHAGGTLRLTSVAGGKSIRANGSDFNNINFSGSGFASWTMIDTNATTSGDILMSGGDVTLPTGRLSVGGSFNNSGGSFVHSSGLIDFTSTAAGRSITAGGSSFNNIAFNGGGGEWTFQDIDVTIASDIDIKAGRVFLPTGTTTIGGSLTNSDAFVHPVGTVLFNASSLGHNIDVSTSTFYNVVFDNALGGWTILNNATSSNSWTISNAESFTVNGGKTVEVDGEFQNNANSASTTWAGSTLYLNSASQYEINAKASMGDTYGTFIVGSSTDISMWNSDAGSYVVAGNGSLYSQDHADNDGDLYIWGDYLRSSGNEFWNYSNDFDGAGLSGGNQRQVNVRLADMATSTFTGGTFNLLGYSSASTTVNNQGSGTYAVVVDGALMNGEYYQFRNLNASGLQLLGLTNITSLNSGDFELSVNGGTMITIASSTITANAELQLDQLRFATSTGITSGFNVTGIGTSSSFWWFRNHYGNYDGELYDNDPVSSPGEIRWDDSGYSITISGYVYDNTRTATSTRCDSITQVINLRVDGAGVYSSSCNVTTGYYSIPGVNFTGDAVITAYFNGISTTTGAVITRTPTGDISDLDLYERHVVVRHEDVSPMTIANMAIFDSDNDGAIPFNAMDGVSDTLTVEPENALLVWPSMTFVPGGDVTLQSGGSGELYDGSMYIEAGSTFTAVGTETHSIGGNFDKEASATFTSANSLVVMTATTTGKYIKNEGTFYNLDLNGVGGEWNATSTLTVNNVLTLSDGTLIGENDIAVLNGSATGDGAIALTAGTFSITTSGSLGGDTDWAFNNLLLNGTTATTTKVGTSTITINGVLTIGANRNLDAATSTWYLAGSSTPMVVSGSLFENQSHFVYSSPTDANIVPETYYDLSVAPSSGTPTFTILSGYLNVSNNLVLGNGSTTVVTTADTNDPTITVSGDILITGTSTFVGSSANMLTASGNWTNQGTFTHALGSILFNAGDSGNTIDAGGSAFSNVTFDNVLGEWEIIADATTTGDLTITNAALFTQATSTILEVGGDFTNVIGGSATDWTNATLYLNNAGGNYTINTKTTGSDNYNILQVGVTTHVSMWNSSATTISVDATGSLYSQDHAGVNGDLYIWGAYQSNTGSDYWSYATDFDGTDLSGGSERGVNVRFASSSSSTYTGGSLHIVGTTTATTTIDNQGEGTFSITVNGANINAQYFQLRNMDAIGLNLSGSTVVTDLSYGDFELSQEGGSMMTVAGATINNNPLKILYNNRFATSTGITSGYNVTANTFSVSAWRMSDHYGNYDGELFNNDLGGDPGYIIWDNSNAAIYVSGNVYSDEGSTVSSLCDGSTSVVQLAIQGTVYGSTTCALGTGFYQISGINYNPGDVFTVYLNTGGGAQAANVTVDPLTNIGDMHLYENRVIVRHEDATPLTIYDMVPFDSSNDIDVPFTAISGSPDTLTLPPEKKLIIWDNKTFIPGGNITLNSGGSGEDYDGSLHIRNNATLSAAGTQSHSIGGSFIASSTATYVPANSIVTFTATTTGKTITTSGSAFYNATFNGSGGGWTFTDTNNTVTNDFLITAGSVALPTGNVTVGGSFDNSAGTFTHSGGTLILTSGATENVRANGSSFGSLSFTGAGVWTMLDTNATTTGDVSITAGSVILPTGVLEVGADFDNTSGSFTHSGGELKLTATATGTSVTSGGSSFNDITFDGVGGGWEFQDMNSTAVGDVSIKQGEVIMPTGTFTIGGSFINTGSFLHPIGTLLFNAGSTGHFIDVGASTLFNVVLNNALGGWTLQSNATTTSDFSITNANLFTLSSGKSLEILGDFTNSVGGGATTWTDSTLYLNSASTHSINTKSSGEDVYNILKIGADTDISMWDSRASTYIVDDTGSLYSQDHDNVPGDLYIWGDYRRTSGTEYWSYARDFDGTDLSGGSQRQVDVRLADAATTTFAGATLEMVGVSTASTTVANQGSGLFSLIISDGSIEAEFYSLRDLSVNGLQLLGNSTVTSLDDGDYELSVNGGSMITVASTTIDVNASKQFFRLQFATSTGITSGYNVLMYGSTTNSWTMQQHSGNYDGEAYDSDTADECGSIRWSDSVCLFVNQSHYRWRNDDGGEGVPADLWYNASWSKRKKISITDTSATTLSDFQVKLIVDFDTDMQADFDDLRFTDSTGTTSLDFWIESYVVSGSSTVWVKVPSIPASDTTDIYMYYGNGGVSTTGSGTSTFIYFDDFEDGGITEYTDDDGFFNVGTTYNYEGTYGLDASGSESEKTTDGMYQTSNSVSTGSTIRFFQYVNMSGAGGDDEPCTLFGVQTPGSGNNNYAVCLDSYPSDLVVIAENVSSNDGSGSTLATTSVTWTTGWYEVEIDWLTDNSIDVTVYDPSDGSVFATTSVSDASYSTGGTGFAFWYQNGGWDFYTARQYASSDPTYVFSLEQGGNGATWKQDEDTILNSQDALENIRLRFAIENSGPQITNQNFLLEYASRNGYGNCASVPYSSYDPAPTVTGGCGTDAVCMTSSAQFLNKASTTPLLTEPAMTFTYGQILEDPSEKTDAMTVENLEYTELEYNFELTSNAIDSAYCFRVTDDGSSLDNYAFVAELVLKHIPKLSNFSFNGNQHIALVEGTTTQIMATGTITDLNGWTDIDYATSTFYRTGVAGSCTQDFNNCYQIASTSCALASCSGNSCEVQCSADMYYFADPTDSGAYSTESWAADISVFDMSSETATDTSMLRNLYTLRALGVQEEIDYGTLVIGATTDTYNATTTLVNTGNDNIDVQVSGTDLAAGASSIDVAYQKFATSTFAYGSCSICQFLTGTSTQYEVDLPKPTSPAEVSDALYWGLKVPVGTAGVAHTGQNLFIAVSD